MVVKKLHLGYSRDMSIISCEKHNHRGNMPCPWLNCSNGIEENEFIDSTFEKTDTPQHYIRKKWFYSDGSERYSWYEKNMPAIFTIYRILQEDSFNINFGSKTNIIYHYTTIQGLEGIIKSKSFWMTDFKYMNDYREIIHGLDLIDDVLKDLKKCDIYKEKEESFNILKKFVRKGIKKRICISCFSADNGDNLSQWRGYGNDGAGISIGLKANSSFWDYNPLALLQRVIYDTKEQKKIIENIIHTYLIVSTWEDKNEKEFLNSKKMLKRCITSIYEHITYFKDNSFKDEKEVRWVYKSNNNFLKNTGKLKKPKKEFRTSNNKIIPYLSSNNIPEDKNKYLSTIKRDTLPIEDIVVGPQKDADLIVSGLKELLKVNGYKNVKVRKSTVPYRS